MSNKSKEEQTQNTMMELVHFCLRCNERAYETAPNFFECSVCDFAWKVNERV
jgi:ribosomal protein L37E